MFSGRLVSRMCFNSSSRFYATKSIGKLHKDLQWVLTEVRKERNFQHEKWIPAKIDMINNYMTKNSLSGCVVSVSGGIDSAVTLGLLHAAHKHPTTPIKEIIAVAQPIHSTGEIQNRAYEHCEQLGVKCITVDQSKLHTQLTSLVEEPLGISANSFSKGQLRSYMRTPVAYFVAQLLAQEGNPAIVVGTGNYDEDGYLMYFCKCGDGVSDVQLINDLHKSEVYTVGNALNVPETILKSKPSADLWEGQTDEDELGFGYDAVELYTSWKSKDMRWKEEKTAKMSDAAKKQLEQLGQAIEVVHQRNKHKANFPVNLNYQQFQAAHQIKF